MLSPDSRARRRTERVLRAIAVLALALALWQSARPRSLGGTRVAGGEELTTALARWTTVPPETAVATFARAPTPATRDWLVALRRSGSVVRWGGNGLTPVAAAVERVAEPGGSVRVVIAAPPGTRAALADDAGALGSVVAGRWGGGVSGMRTSGVVTATTSGAVVRVAPPPALALRRVLVLGTTGWESKFVVAALEERGWTVDARLSVAPGVTVTQGAPASLDTSRYSAVIALDRSAASWARRIAGYVQSGGGAIVVGEASRVRALAAIAPGSVGARLAGVQDAITGAHPLRGLALHPVTRLREDAVPLGRRDAMVTIVARRAGAGRILQSGYAESWRWRMLGGDDAADAHRAWWSRAVSSVAYAPVVRTRENAGPDTSAATMETSVDGAPLAHLIAALGDAAPAGSELRGGDAHRPGEWLFAGIAVMALMAEWASRRLSGLS